MSNEVYIVTGAAGLLGSNIVKELAEEGKEVRAFVLPKDPAAQHIDNRVKIIEGDITKPEDLEKLFDGCLSRTVYVIHSASIVTLAPDYSEIVYRVNVEGTKNMIDKCIEYGAAKMIYVSSTSAIPELLGNKSIQEVSSFSPDGLVGYYAQSKAMATQLVVDALEEEPNFDACIVHPSGICGPNDYSFGPVAEFLLDYGQGKMSMGIEGTFNSVDVRDLASAIITATQKGIRGSSYILSNELVTMEQMFNLVNQAAGYTYSPKILSAKTAKRVARFTEKWAKITKKPARLTSFAVYNLTRNNNFDSSKAKEELGFRTRPFAETIQDEMVWLKAEGKL